MQSRIRIANLFLARITRIAFLLGKPVSRRQASSHHSQDKPRRPQKDREHKDFRPRSLHSDDSLTRFHASNLAVNLRDSDYKAAQFL